MKKYWQALWLNVALVLVGCSTEINDYQDAEPKFDLFNYFTGTTHAWGWCKIIPINKHDVLKF